MGNLWNINTTELYIDNRIKHLKNHLNENKNTETKCSYDVPNSNPVARIFPHLEVRKENNNKSPGKWDYWVCQILQFASKRQNFLALKLLVSKIQFRHTNWCLQYNYQWKKEWAIFLGTGFELVYAISALYFIKSYNLKFKNKPRHLHFEILQFFLDKLQLSKKRPSKNPHHRRLHKTIPTVSSLCTHSCPRGSITSSSHVFTNPESTKLGFLLKN